MSERNPVLGILLLDTHFPRIPGDVGNPRFYPFPVQIKTVTGATVKRAVYEADPDLETLFIDSAIQLAEDGVSAITSSCGFLSPLQKSVAAAVDIPVFLSSLIQVNLAFMMTQRRVAVFTANAERMTKLVLESAGITVDIPIALVGLEDISAFRDPILKNGTTLEPEQIEREILSRVDDLLQIHPDIGSFVFECHNLAPYAKAVQTVSGRPVFDIIDFAKWVYTTIKKHEYPI